MPFPQEVVPYAPWKYMYPRQWRFGSVGDAFGLGQTFQLQTTVSDVVGIHWLAFNLLVPTGGHPSGQISYTYSRLWPSLSLSLARTDLMTNGLVVDQQNCWSSLSQQLITNPFPALPAGLGQVVTFELPFAYRLE